MTDRANAHADSTSVERFNLFDRSNPPTISSSLAEAESYTRDLLDGFEPATLDDDPAFTRLLDSLDEYAKASERSARRSFVCAIVSLAVAAISATAAVLALLKGIVF